MITLTKKTTADTGEQRITYQAAAVYVAREIYAEAVKETNPAATLDNICDALPEVMPEVFKTLGTAPDLAKVLLPEVADQMWAYTAIEYARGQVGDGYGYLLDFLVSQLRAGADPHAIRDAALDVPRRLRALAAQAGGDE